MLYFFVGKRTLTGLEIVVIVVIVIVIIIIIIVYFLELAIGEQLRKCSRRVKLLST